MPCFHDTEYKVIETMIDKLYEEEFIKLIKVFR